MKNYLLYDPDKVKKEYKKILLQGLEKPANGSIKAI
jgi:hypothetical protein